MARAYTTPGVQVIETANPALATGVGTLSRIALVGIGSGYQSATERILLTATDPVTLAKTGLDLSQALNADTSLRSPLVKLSAQGTILDPGNYLVVVGTDPDAGVTGDEPYTIARITQPTTAPTLTAGTGALTGTYTYAVSYVNSRGETGIGTESSPITLTAQGVNLSAIPVAPAQTGVTWSARKIYRKKTVASGGDGLFHLVATIADNVTTVLANEAMADATAQAAAQSKTGLASGDTILVSYKYTDNNYFEPVLFEDFDDVAEKYGAPFDADGNISSKLTFAARMAFSNGASELIIVAATANNGTAFGTATDKLRGEETVAFVVPVTGDTAIHTTIAAHVAAMNTEGQYRMGIVGQDGSAAPVTAATLRSAGQGFNSEAMILVSPTSFNYINPETGREVAIGAQYLAAAVAGMFAARDPQVPLTRKSVAAISGVNDKRTETEKQQDSSAGLLVIEDKGGVIRVRHGVTTKPGNPNTQEASVVRSKYEMARRIHDTLDRNVIGLVAPLDETPLIVKGVVTGVLETLRAEGVISSWGQVKARTLGDPTTVEVRFEYVPAYPINRVEVRFKINTESGIFELT